MDCIFCKIASGQIPCTKIYENDDVIAFFDLHPSNLGHTLVVPKAHFENCAQTDDGALAAAAVVAKKVGAAAMAATGAQGYNVVINCGPAAGQVVMHTHVHVVPRFENDGLATWPKKDVPDDAKQKAAEEMRRLLAA